MSANAAPPGAVLNQEDSKLQEHAHQLRELLLEERDALVQRDVDALDEIGAKKSTLLGMLESRLADGPNVQFSHSPKLADTIAECRQLNRSNGAILQAFAAQARNALSILTCRPLNTDTYGASGELSEANIRRQLTEV